MSMIGILGGTFDPIHFGHIRLGEQALEKLGLDEVQFLPCATPVHRNRPVASAMERKKMLELALYDRPRMKLNSLELDRDGLSFMVDTLREIKAKNRSDTVCLLLGVDAFNQFSNWKNPEEILSLAHLVICSRPGLACDSFIFERHWVKTPDELFSSDQGKIMALNIDECECSSTQVRQQIKNRQLSVNCLPPPVTGYILNQHLYEN